MNQPAFTPDPTPLRPAHLLAAPPVVLRIGLEVDVAHLANPLVAVERLLATEAGAFAQVAGDERRFEVRVALPDSQETTIAEAEAWIRWAVFHAGLRGAIERLRVEAA